VWYYVPLGDELLLGELRRLFLQSEVPVYGVKRPEKAIGLMNLLNDASCPASYEGDYTKAMWITTSRDHS